MLAKGEPAKAVELLDRALALYASNPDRAKEAFTRLQLGRARLQLGDPAKAGEELARSVELARAVSAAREPHDRLRRELELLPETPHPLGY